MAPGVLQDCNWTARGCASRSFFVRFLYASKALLMISWKLEDELEDEDAVGLACDMEAEVSNLFVGSATPWA
jgi:hypothetical protein